MNHASFSSKTYQPNKPFQTPAARGFLLLVVLLIVLTLLAQVSHLSPLRASFPPPALDSRNPEFNAKINALEIFARQYGGVDCLLLGSSHIDYGLNPAVIAQTYQRQTDHEMHCFNFGLATLTADTAAPLAQMLVRRYHPRVLVVEISAHSFDKRFGGLARPLIKNTWIRNQLGEPSLDGWLLEHLSIYSDYKTFKLWQQPYSREIMLTAWSKMDENGYSAHTGQQSGAQEKPTVYEFQIDPAFWQSFQSILALNGQTRLILLEAPIQPTALPDYIKGGEKAYETRFIPRIAAELKARSIPFWRAQLEVTPQIPDAMWFDTQHLNSDGAVLFSKWLAQRLATP